MVLCSKAGRVLSLEVRTAVHPWELAVQEILYQKRAGRDDLWDFFQIGEAAIQVPTKCNFCRNLKEEQP
jgi:hypothetical protein